MLIVFMEYEAYGEQYLISIARSLGLAFFIYGLYLLSWEDMRGKCAIDLCQPGDIVVIDSHGSINTAFWGENMTMSAINRGVVAAVIDGACRDIEEIRKLKFPVICKGFVPNVGSISGYGHVNVPIQCAGVPVNPGDIIVVDANGVVVVPQTESATILEKALHLLKTEYIIQEKIKAGATIGELINVDEVFANVFSYQNRAVEKNK